MKVSTMRNLQFTTFRQYATQVDASEFGELKIFNADRAFIRAGLPETHVRRSVG